MRKKFMMPMLACALLFLLAVVADAGVVEKTFHVGETTVERLCEKRSIVAINGQLPGPTIEAREGDTVIVHVINKSPHNITIHWHGIFQLLSAWADGPSFVTQCPIQPGNKYTYRFKIKGQEGTLWYHAHVSFLRATVYGALIIRPTRHATFPFPNPHKEIPILLGEWWNSNVIDVEREALVSGAGPNISDAFTINGMPGHLYPCSDHNQIFKVNVTRGNTYLLRIINAALNNQHFFKVAGHRFTVVAADAAYTTPYDTDVLVLSPGNTVDALMVADASPATYYMVGHPYASAAGIPFDNTTTTAILQYDDSGDQSSPIMPASLPQFNDSSTANTFYTSLTASITSSSKSRKVIPLEVDERMFVTLGMGISPCNNNSSSSNVCGGPLGGKLASSMNNVSFELPTKLSLLQAHVDDVLGIFTNDFPDNPPVVFNYTSPSVVLDQSLLTTVKGTRLKKLTFNSSVEIVLQSTALLGTESHPIHLHGFNFFVVAQGIGNYDPVVAEKSLNLVNPQERNTIPVLPGGWAVIRFRANNPGVWIMHCHLDVHLPIGLATGFVVENGPTLDSTLPPPPSDLPRC